MVYRLNIVSILRGTILSKYNEIVSLFLLAMTVTISPIPFITTPLFRVPCSVLLLTLSPFNPLTF